jgi:ribosomal protein S18
MWRRKAFINNYAGEGVDETDFVQAADNLRNFLEEYGKIGGSTEE